MKPYIHAESSARRFKGKPEDYLEIHTFMDSSKASIASNAHRMLTHNSWFIKNVIERIKFSNSVEVGDRFPYILNSDEKKISVEEIAEMHILEDFRGFIPTPQDYASLMNYSDWLDNGKGHPPSGAILVSKKRKEQGLESNTHTIWVSKKREGSSPYNFKYVDDSSKPSQKSLEEIEKVCDGSATDEYGQPKKKPLTDELFQKLWDDVKEINSPPTSNFLD